MGQISHLSARRNAIKKKMVGGGLPLFTYFPTLSVAHIHPQTAVAATTHTSEKRDACANFFHRSVTRGAWFAGFGAYRRAEIRTRAPANFRIDFYLAAANSHMPRLSLRSMLLALPPVRRGIYERIYMNGNGRCVIRVLFLPACTLSAIFLPLSFSTDICTYTRLISDAECAIGAGRKQICNVRFEMVCWYY